MNLDFNSRKHLFLSYSFIPECEGWRNINRIGLSDASSFSAWTSLEAGRLRDTDLFSEVGDILVPTLFVVHAGQEPSLAANTETRNSIVIFSFSDIFIYKSIGAHSTLYTHVHETSPHRPWKHLQIFLTLPRFKPEATSTLF